jgi:hypothetical protein
MLQKNPFQVKRFLTLAGIAYILFTLKLPAANSREASILKVIIIYLIARYPAANHGNALAPGFKGDTP